MTDTPKVEQRHRDAAEDWCADESAPIYDQWCEEMSGHTPGSEIDGVCDFCVIHEKARVALTGGTDERWRNWTMTSTEEGDC